MGMWLAPLEGAEKTVDFGLSFSWEQWSWLAQTLAQWGVDTCEFSEFNDGASICAQTCVAIASAIERHAMHVDDDPPGRRFWLQRQITEWRNAAANGGFAQW